MDYKIENRQLIISDDKYWILSGELNNFSVEQLSTVINEIDDVLNGKFESSSFCGDVVFTVEYNMEIAKIEYYNEYIGEEPTVEIQKMLKNYMEELLHI